MTSTLTLYNVLRDSPFVLPRINRIIFSTDASRPAGEVAVSDVIMWSTRRVSS